MQQDILGGPIPNKNWGKHLRSLWALLPARGVMLRGAVDAGAVCAAFVFGELLGKAGELANTMIQPTARTVAGGGVFAVCAFAACHAAGLYSGTGSHALLVKIRRIILINLVFLIVACAVLAFTEELTSFMRLMLLMTFSGSTLLLCLVRVGSSVVRCEVRNGDNAARCAETGENNVLVIGGAGYIGSLLVEKLLAQGLQVSILDAMHYGEESIRLVAGHPNLTIIRDDFRHIEVFTRAVSGVGSVIHLGGLVGDPACAVDADLTIDVNVTATRLLGEIAKAEGVRRIRIREFLFSLRCLQRDRDRGVTI